MYDIYMVIYKWPRKSTGHLHVYKCTGIYSERGKVIKKYVIRLVTTVVLKVVKSRSNIFSLCGKLGA